MTNPKLGDVYMHVQDLKPGMDRTERDFYVLAKSKNPNKPNTVGLWRINPLTMTDDPKWRYRKMWNQTKVQDPDNMTEADFKNITQFKFIKLSEESKEVVKAIYAGTKVVHDWANEFKLVTIYERVF